MPFTKTKEAIPKDDSPETKQEKPIQLFKCSICSCSSSFEQEWRLKKHYMVSSTYLSSQPSHHLILFPQQATHPEDKYPATKPIIPAIEQQRSVSVKEQRMSSVPERLAIRLASVENDATSIASSEKRKVVKTNSAGEDINGIVWNVSY